MSNNRSTARGRRTLKSAVALFMRMPQAVRRFYQYEACINFHIDRRSLEEALADEKGFLTHMRAANESRASKNALEFYGADHPQAALAIAAQAESMKEAKLTRLCNKGVPFNEAPALIYPEFAKGEKP